MGKTELKIEIDADLLARAEATGRPLSDLVEQGLRSALGPADGEDRGRRWAAQNAEAIADHQRRIEQVGVFGEDLRRG